MHKLWILCEEMNSSEPLEEATDEEIICALFDAPQHLNPKYFGYLRRNRQEAICQYQSLFYAGEIPSYVPRPGRKD